MSVPRVDLSDPECEPSDTELEALMQSVCDTAIEGNRRVRERCFANLADSVARAARGETRLGPCVGSDRLARRPPPTRHMTGGRV